MFYNTRFFNYVFLLLIETSFQISVKYSIYSLRTFIFASCYVKDLII